MKKRNENIEREAVLGIVPVTTRLKQYGFWDVFLVQSGANVATWCYTQGEYMSSLVNFKQMMIGIFFASIFMLVLFELPVILSTRYGIDVYIWLKGALGVNGMKVIVVFFALIILPWYAICAELFASSMINLFALGGIQLGPVWKPIFGVLCVAIGMLLAYLGVRAIAVSNRIMVPMLVLVGFIVVYIAVKTVSLSAIINYEPSSPVYADPSLNYALMIEGCFAYVLAQIGAMGEFPRISKTERGGVWGNVLQQIPSGLYIVVGAVMAIAMFIVTGATEVDPTVMIATLSSPGLALLSIVLVGFANVSTQSTACYNFSIMLRSVFKKVSYNKLVVFIGLYCAVIAVWGKVTEYFGTVLAIGALFYAPLGGLLLADFFIVRKQKIDLRSAYELRGHDAYRYHHGFNLLGILSILFGVAVSLLVFDPISYEIRIESLFRLTPTLCAFFSTAIFYVLGNCIPAVRKYNLQDRAGVTV